MMDSEAKADTTALAVPGPAALPALSGGRQAAMVTAFQGLIPTSIGEAMTLAVALSKSKAIPKAYRGKPDDVLVVVLAGLEVGLTPIRSVNNLTNISGNLGMKADLQLALVRRSGLLEFYDEGFEVRGKTDTDLADRAQDGAKILALVKAVPDGKPYGWATAQRKGDRNIVTRTFTWIDADTAEIWERDEDDDSGQARKKTKLSAKFNYVSFPADMYPKRARGRVLQVTHSDVLAGMLSTEALEGGQVIDVTPEPADTVDDLMAEAGDDADAIRAGFDFLEFSPARRLQKMIEYRGRYSDLVTWLRDEAGQRTGKGKVGTARKSRQAAAQVIDVDPKAPPAETKPAGPETKPAPADPKPADPDTNRPPAETTAVQGADAGESFVKALDDKFPKPADAAPGPAAPTNDAWDKLKDPVLPGPKPGGVRASDAAAKFRERFGAGAGSF